MSLNRCEACLASTRDECLGTYSMAVLLDKARLNDSQRVAETHGVDTALEFNGLGSRAVTHIIHEKLGKIGCLLTEDEVSDNIAFFREEIRKRNGI